MGTPLPPNIIEPGNDCNTCWGPEQTFDLPTPTKVQAQLFDWSEGDRWDEKYRNELSEAQTLTQLLSNPCEWSDTPSDLVWIWRYVPDESILTILELFPGTGRAFLSDFAGICKKEVDNALGNSPLSIIFGGYAQITFGAP